MKKKSLPCSFCYIDGGCLTCFGCFGIPRYYLSRRRELKRQRSEYWFPQNREEHGKGSGPGYRPPRWPEPELRPLPVNRPSSPSQTASEQLQSWFVNRIPVELRLVVWEYVVGKDVLHLDLANGILRCASCSEEDRTKLGFKHVCWQDAVWWSQFERDGYHWLLKQEHPARRTSLLLTCKLFYQEAVNILYSSNTFDFRRSIAVYRLPRIILPQRFHQIRSLSFSTVFKCPTTRWDISKVETVPSDKYSPPDNVHDWLKACRVLALMNNLHDLAIELVFWGSYPYSYGEQIDPSDDVVVALLMPLKVVSAEKFSVFLGTTLTSRAKDLLREAPFVVRKI